MQNNEHTQGSQHHNTSTADDNNHTNYSISTQQSQSIHSSLARENTVNYIHTVLMALHVRLHRFLHHLLVFQFNKVSQS